MRACIYGAGAMGTVLGAFMARAGEDVELVTRNLSHVAALNAAGARIGGADGGELFTCRVKALPPSAMSGRYDIVFLMTKQRDNAQTVRYISNFLAPGGAVCTLQNGLPEDSVAAVVGRENTLGCAVSWGATFVQPGYVLMTSSPDAMSFALGSPYGESEKIPLAAGLLKCAGRVYTEKNFIGARWSKLIVNSAFSSLSAITSFTFGRIAAGRDTRPAAQRLLKEGIDTALACGVTPAKIQGHDLVKWLNYSGAVKRALSYALIPVAMKKHKNLVSGMYFDLAAGKKSEMDAIAGAVAAHARAAGVKVPVTQAVLSIAARIEGAALAPSPENIAELGRLLKNEL